MSRMSYEEFYKRGILQYRDLDKSRGINAVYSGFYDHMRDYYGHHINPRNITEQLVEDGKIESRLTKGGVMLYLPGEAYRQRPHMDIKDRAAEKLPIGVFKRDGYFEPGERICGIDDETCDEGFGIHNIGYDSPMKSCRHGAWDSRDEDSPCKNPEDTDRKRRKMKLTPKRNPIRKIKKKIQRKCRCIK